ncbi:MAG: hypothetical protein LBJ67_00095 [Planctomycetaceae bacterium]|nr:hypothetical protein [Planctomycetaceae bacterium]
MPRGGFATPRGGFAVPPPERILTRLIRLMAFTSPVKTASCPQGTSAV